MRINQIARKYGLENKIIIDYLDSIGVPGKSHSSSVDEGTIEILLQHFDKLEAKAAEIPKEINKRFAKIRRPKSWKPSDNEYQDAEPLEDVQEVELPKNLESPTPPLAPVTATSTPETTPQLEKVDMMLPAEDVLTEKIADKAAEKPFVKVTEPVVEQKQVDIPQPQQPVAPKPVKEKKAPSKNKIKHIPLDTIKVRQGDPKIITEAPQIDDAIINAPSPITEIKVKKVVPKEHARAHDEDEAIRREIQKLKMKQRKAAEPDKPPKQKQAQAQAPKQKQEEAPKKQQTRTNAKPARPQHRRPARTSTRGKKGKQAWKREKREKREMLVAREAEQVERDKTILKVHDATTVADVANGLGIMPATLIQKLITLGVMVSINQPLEFDTIQIIADEFDFQVEKVDLFNNDIFTQLWQEDTNEEKMVSRSPVVTIMGHVDHGKTKLLDAVRSSDVVSGEAGGITQHIGAYHVNTPGGDIVFLDTPGHEAFTAMRARGAMVTDLVVLVVSAADGVMPQTVEAIHHAKAAGVPIIVAVNKIDLESANQDRVKQQLAEHGLTPEDWGGDVVMIPLSALKKIGINDLLESVLLQAEILELKADPECRARGTIIESRLEQGRGPIATALIQQGSLKIGDPFVTGVYSGRIKAMQDEHGKPILEAGPSTPVEILGIENVPSAGDPFIVVKDDAQAKHISAKLQQIQRERDLRRTHHVTLEDLHTQIEEGSIKDLQVIIKGDVQGSVGAVCESLMKIESSKVRIDILHSGVGAVSESDVMLASASNAIIIGFNVRPHPQVSEIAKREHVDIRTYRIIYQVISDIKNAMEGMLEKTFEEKILGRGEVREVFRLSRGLSIAGLFIQDGRLLRNLPVRLLRDSVVIHEGKLSSLRRFKEDVREVQSGFECGIGLERFNDIRDGDILECYKLEELAPSL